MKIINTNNWIRKEHFDFFSKYDNPFFGIVSEIDCTKAYLKSKEQGISFFAYYLHKSIIAVNSIDEFKFRIVDEKVVCFENIHAAATIGRKDGTFGFSFMNYSNDFNKFNEALKQEMEIVKNTTGLRANNDARRPDVIHYSSLPWINFTGLTHAMKFKNKDSVPKISFGKISIVDDKRILPISIDVHHGFVDGLHVARYLEIFQKLMNE